MLRTVKQLSIAMTFALGALLPMKGVAAQDYDVERAVPQSNTQIQLSYAPLVSRAAPAVVNIYTKKVVRSRRSALFDDPLFQRFFW